MLTIEQIIIMRKTMMVKMKRMENLKRQLHKNIENNGFKEFFSIMTDMVSDHDMEKLICDKSFTKSNDENEDDYPKSNGEAVAGPDEEASHFLADCFLSEKLKSFSLQ